VTHFGLFVEESADDYGRRDAMQIVRDAVVRTVEENMRAREVFAALPVWCSATA
jgi:hypothetical protein